MIHFGLREFDQGFAEMEKAYQAHDPYLLYMRVDPAFDPVRKNFSRPGCRKLLITL